MKLTPEPPTSILISDNDGSKPDGKSTQLYCTIHRNYVSDGLHPFLHNIMQLKNSYTLMYMHNETPQFYCIIYIFMYIYIYIYVCMKISKCYNIYIIMYR